jgi:hypothetical protein
MGKFARVIFCFLNGHDWYRINSKTYDTPDYILCRRCKKQWGIDEFWSRHSSYSKAMVIAALMIIFSTQVQARHHHIYHHHWHYHRHHSTHTTAGLNYTLANKVAKIQNACRGTYIVSSVRHTYVHTRHGRRISLHASGDAADLRGPYRCIYAQLRGWPGGVSMDWDVVDHVHVSYDARYGREMGLRFWHHGGAYLIGQRHHANRHYARRYWHRRYYLARR